MFRLGFAHRRPAFPVLVLGFAGLGFAVFLVGCRTVWIHPEATPAKFDADKAQCERDVAMARQQGTGPRNWKACLLAQSWSTRTDFKWADSVREPWPEHEYPGPRGRRD